MGSWNTRKHKWANLNIRKHNWVNWNIRKHKWVNWNIRKHKWFNWNIRKHKWVTWNNCIWNVIQFQHKSYTWILKCLQKRTVWRILHCIFVQSTYNINIPVFINKGVKEKKDDSEQLKVSVQQLAQAPLRGKNGNL